MSWVTVSASLVATYCTLCWNKMPCKMTRTVLACEPRPGKGPTPIELLKTPKKFIKPILKRKREEPKNDDDDEGTAVVADDSNDQQHHPKQKKEVSFAEDCETFFFKERALKRRKTEPIELDLAHQKTLDENGSAAAEVLSMFD